MLRKKGKGSNSLLMCPFVSIRRPHCWTIIVPFHVFLFFWEAVIPFLLALYCYINFRFIILLDDKFFPRHRQIFITYPIFRGKVSPLLPDVEDFVLISTALALDTATENSTESYSEF